MSYAKLFRSQTPLLTPYIVDIEADLSRGLHAFNIVGMPDQAVEESKDRISAAIKNSGFESPKQQNHKIVIALAPAEIKKEGAGLDLGIALSYLLANEEIDFRPDKNIFLGELSLDGNLRRIKGVLALTRAAKEKGFEAIFLPKENAYEAALVEGIKVFGASDLREVIDHVEGKEVMKASPQTRIKGGILDTENDFSDIKGNQAAKRALQIAGAGSHNIALYGPPGTGKTMLARAFASILPPLSFEEMLEVTEIHSISGNLKGAIVTERPFRSPHHTSSYVSLVGGGASPKPGEITLAHKGVLFLDEFPEFEARRIESLRQPLEDRFVSVSRARGSARFPAHFILVAAMNPCPCGNFGVKGKPCICSPIQIQRYKKKMSGPIIDRIGMRIEVSKVEHESLSNSDATQTNKIPEKESSLMREKILKAREIARDRFKKIGSKVGSNGEMGAREVVLHINLSKEAKEILDRSAKQLDLSARSYHKIMKVARTIADLDSSIDITPSHILEAISYRPKSQMY